MVYANIWLRRASKHAGRHETCPCSRTGPGSDFHHDAMTPLRKVPMLHPPLREKTNPPTHPPPKKKNRGSFIHTYQISSYFIWFVVIFTLHLPPTFKKTQKNIYCKDPKNKEPSRSRRCKPPAWCHLYASDFETPRSNSWPQQPPTQQQ